MDITDFPKLADGLSERYAANLNKNIHLISTALNAGSIPNPRYKEAKEAVERAIERAWDRLRNHFGWGEEALDAVPRVANAHRVEKKLAELPQDDDVVVEALAFINEIKPLINALVFLKDKIVKRQPKPEEERKDVYVAPAASRKAATKVHDLLVALTREAHADIVATFSARYWGYLHRYLNEVTPIRGRYPSPTSWYRDRKNASAGQVVLRLVGYDSEHKPVEKENASQTVTQLAEKDADEICSMFIGRMMGKLDSILERKPDLDEAKIVHSHAGNAGLEGTLWFSFKDGSKFKATFQAVFVVNNFGTRFFRFPVTFHDVYMADGSRLKAPNEEKMNTTFVGL